MPKDSEVPHTSSADTSDRFAIDALLRKNGFKVHLRSKGLVMWRAETGEVYTEAEALALLHPPAVHKAERRQKAYWRRHYMEDTVPHVTSGACVA
jgi:hypothetical protein